jgi:hypothetical protein
MNYLLLMYLDEQILPDTDPKYAECVDYCEGLVERLDANGNYIAGGILQPVACATSLRVREGRRLVTDGPFAETREQLGGYLLIEAGNLEEAIAIATQHPVAQVGTVEVRPMMEVPYLAPNPLAAKA